jgi:hypothetical protein
VNSEIAPVFLGRAWPFVALGVFLQISIRQRLKRAGRGGLTLGISRLNGVGAVRDLRGHVLGASAGGFELGRRIGPDGGAQCLAGVGMTEAIGERAGTVGGDSQNESGLPQVCNLKAAAPRWLCAAQRVGQNLAHGCSFH